MDLNLSVDYPLSAILGLAKDSVNSDLQTVFGGNAINTVNNHPTPLSLISELNLPVLAAYRAQERQLEATSGYTDQLVTFSFEYITPSVNAVSIGKRWPALETVWKSLVKNLCRGYHPSHASKAKVLNAAGVIGVQVDTIQKTELFAPNGEYTFPMFRGSIQFQIREYPDLSQYADLQSIFGQYAIEAFDASYPHLEQLILTEHGQAVLDSDQDPFSEDLE